MQANINLYTYESSSSNNQQQRNYKWMNLLFYVHIRLVNIWHIPEWIWYSTLGFFFHSLKWFGRWDMHILQPFFAYTLIKTLFVIDAKKQSFNSNWILFKKKRSKYFDRQVYYQYWIVLYITTLIKQKKSRI